MTGDELAAIAVAVNAYIQASTTPAHSSIPSGWTLAMRNPHLEIDDILMHGRHAISAKGPLDVQ